MDDGVPITEYKNKKVGVYGGKFFPFHKGHESFVEKALTYVDILFIAIQYDEVHEAALCAGTPFTPVTPRVRERWITEIYKDNPRVRVFAQYEKRTPNHMTDPEIGVTYDKLRKTVGHVDVIFSNTHEYDDYFAKWLPEAEHIVFLEDRHVYPISATEIRQKGVYKTWDALNPIIQRYYLKRVAFCGWESSGKTYTAQHIAKIYETTYLPEYGRTLFTEELGGYADVALPEDYITIAAGHLQQLHYATGNKILVVDTDLIYTQFYHILDTGKKNPVLDEIIKADAEKIDTYVFLEPYNKFADDGSRFRLKETERKRRSDMLKQLYIDYGKNIIVIDQPDDSLRLTDAVDVIAKILNV